MAKTAREIAEALGGQWRNNHASVCCPAHEDRNPSFSISQTRDGRPLIFCHAGCTQAAVIAALKAKGLWEGDAVRDPGYPSYYTRKHDGFKNDEDRKMQSYARDLWDRCDPIKGTPVQTYLEARGIKFAGNFDSLGYVAGLEHKPTGLRFPAMIGAIRDLKGDVAAVQRTWLTRDGKSKAQVSSPKMTCGPMGSWAVQLGTPTDSLGLAEGIETALSARQIYGISTWATLSANRLGSIAIPKGVNTVFIFADQGDVGKQAAFDAADNYERLGFGVDVYLPKTQHGDTVSDFNDLVRAGA